MGKIKNKKGITLIALVLTIIVLLILAGVSLSLVAGGDGILGKAENAVDASQKASIQEEIELLVAEAKMAYYTDNEANIGTIDEFVEDYLNNNPTSSGAKITYSEGEISYKKDGQIYIADMDISTGKIGKIADETEETKIQEYNSRHPELHIPTGFSHSTGSVNDGYVITDGTNEFVWIPVANDEAYAKKLGANNWYMKLGSSGKEDTNLTLATAVKGDILGVNNILGTTVNSTLDENQPEYAVVKKAGGFWIGRYEAGIESAEHENIAGIESWSREEENANNSNAYWENKKISIKVAQNMEPVRNITQTKALEIANSWRSGNADTTKNTVAFQSGLVTGSQWDATCKFIGWNTCDSDCSSWGNFGTVIGASYKGYHSTDSRTDWFIEESEVIKLGEYKNRWVFPTAQFVNENNGTTVKKNIYDIAGNVWEWTTEVPQYSSENRVRRGGSTNNYAEMTTSRYTEVAVVYEAWAVGFRMVLYVE